MTEVPLPRTYRIAACAKCKEPVLIFHDAAQTTVTTRTMKTDPATGVKTAKIHGCSTKRGKRT